jgi:hypothetical protein
MHRSFRTKFREHALRYSFDAQQFGFRVRRQVFEESIQRSWDLRSAPGG